jgi:hypothetical protein
MRWVQRLFVKPQIPAQVDPWDGHIVDLDQYCAEAWAELKDRQDKLARDYGLADALWCVNQDTGLIEFECKDGAMVRAPVQIIGSLNPQTNVFAWGWRHPNVQARLRANAERTRWFGEKHGLHELTDPKVSASEADAWRLTAMAVKVNAAVGAYRAPTDGPLVFMTIGEATIYR